MNRNVILRARVESQTAIQVRMQAERAHMSTSRWIAAVLRREAAHAGDADALALRDYELLITLGYMVRALMIEILGVEPAEAAIQDASATAADEAAADLGQAREID
jgi:hypothetical protein